VDQHHRLAGAVILVVDLDVCVVFLSGSDTGVPRNSGILEVAGG
jgi:hypothetical protein